MQTTRSGSHSDGWKSEEDYYLARLAISMGLIGQETVEAALSAQNESFAAGQPITLGQLLIQNNQLGPDALVRLKHEMMRCYHTCPGCGVGGYLAPGPQDRVEQCGRCGAAVPVPAAGSTVSQSWMSKRDAALQASGWRGQVDPLSRSGVMGPRLFANYILEDQLAKGGMGAIYRVRHAETHQVYALKVLLAAEKATERQIHRFQREAKAQMELGDHPNIVKIHEAGEWEGILYFSMDLVDGTDLGKAYTALRLDERVTMLAKVARAVQYAHDKGYAHRDLKPANILLTRDNEPLITDFGLAKNIGGNTMLTQEGSVMGTPFYMAPEQATGDVEKMGPTSDIYSLGVLLYEQVTGEVPFRADSQVELYRMILERTPASFAEHGVAEPRLEQICFKAMEKDPALRYSSAAHFADDLERVNRGEAPQISSVTSVERLSRSVERNKRSIGFLLSLAAAGMVVLVGAAVLLKLARDHIVASRAMVAVEADAKVAGQNLDGAARQAADRADSVAALDEAIAVAEALLARDLPTEPVSFAGLRATLRRAYLQRARAGLFLGTGREGRAALQALTKTVALAPEPAEAPVIAELEVRARWRTGDDAGAAKALRAYQAASPADARLAWLLAIEARRAGKLEEALGHVERAGAGDPAVRLERARLLRRAGKLKEARKEVQHTLKGARAVEARRRWVRILVEEGHTREAADVAVAALESTPHDVRAAKWAGALLLTQGRDQEAALVLEIPARGADPFVRDLWLRARARLGEDVAKAIEGSLAGHDLSAARGAPAPYPAADPADALTLRCARLRWEATRGKADIGDLEDEVLARIPADRPPAPELARALRDLGWALSRLGRAEAARRAVEAALRGLPDDVDAQLLRARLVPDAKGAAGRAFAQEADALQGALGRGLLIARQVRFRGEQLLKVKELTAEARALLTARLADGPGLWVVRRELWKLEGKPVLPSADEPVEWDRWVPPLPSPLPREISAKDRAEAKRRVTLAMRLPDAKVDESIAGMKAALKIDPYTPLGRWELLQEYQDKFGSRPWVLLQYLRFLQVRPGWAFGLHLRFVREWKDATLSFDVTPTRSHAAWAKDPKTARDPVHMASSVLDRYFGRVYPDDERLKWTRDTPERILADLGRVVRLDPQMCWLLDVQAHLFALQDRPKLARRALDLATALIGEPNMGHGGVNSLAPYDLLYRAWVLGYHSPEQAIASLNKIPKNAPMANKERILLIEWLKKAPGLKALRKLPEFKRFVRRQSN